MSAGGFLFKGSGNSGGHPLITPLLYQYWRTMRQVGRVFGALFLNLYGSRSEAFGHQQCDNSSKRRASIKRPERSHHSRFQEHQAGPKELGHRSRGRTLCDTN